jgi:hypothetical protein
LLGIGIADESGEFDALSKPTSVRFTALLLKRNEVTVIIMHFPGSSEEANQSNHDLRTTISSFLPRRAAEPNQTRKRSARSRQRAW